MWMNAYALTFRYIPGYQYPEGSPQRSIDHKPSTWVPRMVAAFNGGFHLSDDVGGYFYDGQTVKRLRPGLASLNITAGGRISVGVWGRWFRPMKSPMHSSKPGFGQPSCSI